MHDDNHDKHEKSAVPAEDFEGLQLDTRARDPDVHLDERKRQGMLDDDFDDQMNYINEKQSHTGHDPTSPSSTYVGTMTSPMNQTPGTNAKQFENDFGAPKEDVPPPPQKPRRICGLKPGMFWFLAGLTLALVIAAALVGGIVGGLQSKHHSSPPPPVAPASNVSTGPSFPAASQSDVMIGSPLNIVSYSLDSSKVSKRDQDLSQLQAYRAYYQSLKGDIKEVILSGSSWQAASPIFTDALNNTGLASLSYLNGSEQQGSIFYTGANGLLQEKRRAYNASDSVYWEPGTLNSLNIPMVGNLGDSSNNNDTMNDWNGYRIAAVYSTQFKTTGPGARVFCHAQRSNGSTYVQELVWSQKNDSWIQGATILGVDPNSRLAATIDESLGILRLFYSAGDETLQESYTSLSDQSGAYQTGVHLPNLLTTNTAEIAAVSSNGSTFIFHYTNASATSGGSVTGIQQFTISGSPATANEAFNLSQSLVAAPAYPQGTNASLYQPLAASITSVQGLSEELMVMWADGPVGDPSSNSTGYGQLSQLTRPVGNATWDANGKVAVPLGDKNSESSG